MALLRTVSLRGGEVSFPKNCLCNVNDDKPGDGIVVSLQGSPKRPQTAHPVDDHVLFYWCSQLYLRDILWLSSTDCSLLLILLGGPWSEGGRVWDTKSKDCVSQGEKSPVLSSSTATLITYLPTFLDNTHCSWEKSICVSASCLPGLREWRLREDRSIAQFTTSSSVPWCMAGAWCRFAEWMDDWINDITERFLSGTISCVSCCLMFKLYEV